MLSVDSDARDAVNSLIEICHDGEYGFEEAARGVDDPALQAEFIQYSMQRRDFALALQQAMRSLGEQPASPGSVSAAWHRAWIGVWQAISGSDKTAILSQCERGEDAALDAYRDAMAQSVTPGVDDLVEMQYSSIRRVHDRIRSLREAAKEAN